MEEVTTKKTKKSKAKMSNKIGTMLLALVAIIGIGAAGFFWNQAQDAKSETPEAIAERNQAESGRVIESLDMILLTESEGDPTVARVEDADVLRDANEDFYKNAAEGDYLVLYPQRAILYREAESRIINVAPIINTDQLRANTEGTTPAEGESQPEEDSESETDQEGN